MTSHPSTNGANGRDAKGHFAKGNAGGPGNPHVRRVASFRKLILSAVSAEDFLAVVAALVEKAKAGDIAAIRELFDRLLGKQKSTAELLEEERTEAETLAAIRQRLERLSERLQEADNAASTADSVRPNHARNGARGDV